MAGRTTPFYAQHLRANAKIVDFYGWAMPLHYGSQLNEHFEVRREVGVFDVSHMGIIDVIGSGARQFLRYVLANDVGRIAVDNKALYSCMLTEDGGVIDDVIAYRLKSDLFRLIVNASRRDIDWCHLQQASQKFSVNLEWRNDLCLIALQGPQARSLLQQMLPHQYHELAALKPFTMLPTDEGCIACTGYTGEDGFEIVAKMADAVSWWQRFRDLGVQPCGLGARDTLRLEAGLNLYGQDMDTTTSPYESNLGWTISWAETRDFIGRDALLHWRENAPDKLLVGLINEGAGVLRAGQSVRTKAGATGIITSGGFAPTLNKSIALARIAAPLQTTAEVLRRDTWQKVAVVQVPFVRHGQVIHQPIGVF